MYTEMRLKGAICALSLQQFLKLFQIESQVNVSLLTFQLKSNHENIFFLETQIASTRQR